MIRIFLILIVLITGIISWGGFSGYNPFSQSTKAILESPNLSIPKISVPSPSPKPPVEFKKPGQFKEILPKLQIRQSFNNCGPASLSMLFSYFDTNISQAKIGRQLRPNQNPKGINDDKSVFLPELAQYAHDQGFEAWIRPHGSIELLKTLIENDIPVITRTWLHPGEDIGHYRLVRGYNDIGQQLIQDDSYEGANLKYDYTTFEDMWKAFNYEYLIIVPQEKKELVEAILGNDSDEKIAWENAQKQAEMDLQSNPNDMYARFNLSRALYILGDYQKSITEFEQAESRLPFRMLWYQYEPILAYQKIGNHEKVFTMTQRILNNNNLGYSEMYLIRGESYLIQGDKTSAKVEFEKAVFYNKNLKNAQETLNELTSESAD